jgi:vancomycin resistance protein YoaR
VRARDITAGILLGGAIGAGLAVAAHRFVPESPYLRGLLVGERRLPERGAQAYLEARAERMRAWTVLLRVELPGSDPNGARMLRTTFEALGLGVDVNATLAEAHAVGHQGAIVHRFRDAARARKGQIDVPLAWTFDRERARATLIALADQVRRPAIDARVDLDKHEKITDEAGTELDVEASLNQIELTAREDEALVELITKRIPAKVTLEDLVRVDISKVASAAETTFATWGVGVGRTINIKNAASKIDGIILAPGEMLSFNERVGPRTRERGFALAPEIQGDELTMGYGGGTCQVSSTLHIAAVFGAIEVVERQSHSHPSAYTKLGLDATVSYPTTDLKLRNTLPFPVMIHAYFPKPTMIRVELLGGDPIAKVDYNFGVGSSEDFMRRVVVKPNLAPGTRIKHQKGSRGYDVSSVVTLHFFDGHVEERRYFSGYRPAPEIFWVGPGTDLAELPPLPEHAKGVEGSPNG